MKKTKTLPSEEIGLFCDQVAMVLKAGIPLHDALETLCESYAGTPYGPCFAQVYERLLATGTLYDAVGDEGMFPAYMRGMVRIGEMTGRLEDVMEALSVYYAREARVRESIRSAVSYPTVLILLMGVVIAVLLVSVMPVFSRVYASLGAELGGSGASTGLALGRVVLGVIAVVLLALLGLFFALRTSYRENVLRLLKRCIPSVRRVDDAIFASRFASVISTMLLSGCDLDQAVEMSMQVVSPDRLPAIRACAQAMAEGRPFPEAVHTAGIFQPIHEKMIAVGQQSGRLDTVMRRLSALYEQEADTAMQTLVSAIEPTLVALLCVAIGGILLSVMLPLLSILSDMV